MLSLCQKTNAPIKLLLYFANWLDTCTINDPIVTLMLLALLDGEPTGQEGGYKHAGPLMIVQKIAIVWKELFAIAATVNT